jgi:hypothetical protein
LLYCPLHLIINIIIYKHDFQLYIEAYVGVQFGEVGLITRTLNDFNLLCSIGMKGKTLDLKLSWRINLLKYSREIGRVNQRSEISSDSIIRVDVVNDHLSLIFIPVYQTNVSSYWCTM